MVGSERILSLLEFSQTVVSKIIGRKLRVHAEGGQRGRGKLVFGEITLNWKPRVQLSVIAPPSTPINTDMSLQNYDPGSSKQERQLPGSSDNAEGNREGMSGQGPGGLEVGRSIVPAHGAPSQGQELNATRETLFSSVS